MTVNKILSIYFALIGFNSFAQTEICTVDSIYYVCMNQTLSMDTIIKFNGKKYNYFETDSSGHYAVLGNIHKGVPKGNWYFYYQNIERKSDGLNFNNSEDYDWCYGKVKKKKLHGKWYFYGAKYKVFHHGVVTESWQF